jgi:hypothetical protein
MADVALWIPNGFVSKLVSILHHINQKILLNEKIARANFMVYPVCIMLATRPDLDFFITTLLADFASL